MLNVTIADVKREIERLRVAAEGGADGRGTDVLGTKRGGQEGGAGAGSEGEAAAWPPVVFLGQRVRIVDWDEGADREARPWAMAYRARSRRCPAMASVGADARRGGGTG